MYLISHACNYLLIIPDIFVVYLLYFDDLTIPFGEIQLQSLNSLSCLNQLRPKVPILLQKLFVESFFLLVDSLIIGRKLFLRGFPPRIEGIAGRRVPTNIQPIMRLLEGRHFLMGVADGGTSFL